ncbi:methylated-DNA--[protein]-cysteine S-methyltransferase [Dasania marina]|uniref:methylated-DNA--[protein]-cysteine S-methyltransferase n=1 Tax=Dasania marina TaxID=471499 RepID=UPI00036CB51A|nr:methylated-DNA--[protein]-cysteine S-methyltransferase [Dasania marina]|tara:strand:- start:46076 stop:46906 length:831 start_codon:yes stop_codon:yes gene_type:complete
MSDYDKIAKAISYIRNNVSQQPSLDDIAAQVNLSAFHFQKLFSRWAGVSPKRFLQALTLEHAKQLLKKHKLSTLNASNSLGLSSSSRLYDHFVQLAAVTPSEYKQAGAGLTLHYGYHETLYGHVFIAITDKGICKLLFINDGSKKEVLQQLKQEWPKATLINHQATTSHVITNIFNHPPAANKPISLWVRGTNFQINVWRALLTIKPGELACYGDIATLIGKPKAARAVGTAIGANPAAFIIPCHRVIQQSGGLGGYRWGEVRKQAMLAKETAERE